MRDESDEARPGGEKRGLRLANGQAVEGTRNFMLSTEIFGHEKLDIYAQMVCIVLRSYTGESTSPTLERIAEMGRMSPQQAARSLQSLVQFKILPHKLFREILGQFADDRLTWTAKGILAYCKENPQATLTKLMELSSQSGEDENSLRKALKELSRHGYLDDFSELKKQAN